MSNLSPETVEQLGRLARLDLSAEEKNRYAGQLSAVVGYIEQLSAVPTENVEVKGVSGLVNVLANDQLRTASDPLQFDHQLLLEGVPAREADYILVRAVMAEEAG